MLELIPTGAFTWSYRIKEDGADVGVLTLARIKSAGSFSMHGRQLDLKRASLFGSIDLVEADRTVAHAERKGFVRPNYLVTAEDRQVAVVGTGFLPRAARIVHGDVVIANIRRPNLLRRGVTIDATSGAPAPLLVFCTALVILHWRAAARASS
jgi:hypothetical protein